MECSRCWSTDSCIPHFDVQSAGLSVTAEMLGQSIGAAGALAIVRRVGSRRVVIAALLFIIVGNGLTVGVYSFFRWLLVLRAVAGIGCGSLSFASDFWRLPSKPTATSPYSTRPIWSVARYWPPRFQRCFACSESGGVFAVIAGATALCLWTIPLIPESHRERTVHQENASSATVPFVLCMLTCIGDR